MSESRRQRPRLTRSADALLAGVCGGIAEFVGWRPRGVRWLWLAVTLLTGVAPGAIAYTIMAIAMPAPDDPRERFDLEEFRAQ